MTFSASTFRWATNQPAIPNRKDYAKWKETLLLPAQRFGERHAIQEEIDRTDAWWADTAEREKAQTEALTAQYQKILDKGVFEKMKARAAKAGEDIRRDSARIERLELMRRGIVRGLRKK